MTPHFPGCRMRGSGHLWHEGAAGPVPRLIRADPVPATYDNDATGQRRDTLGRRAMPRVLITGCNRGLGLEFVRQYAEAGWCVLACARAPEAAEALQAIPGDVLLHALDVADRDSIAALAAKLAPMPIDLLIANAGVMPDDRTLFDLDDAAWHHAMQVNALAPLHIARHFRPHLEAGSGRSFAVVTSLMGSITDNSSGGFYSYRMSKAAANMAVRSLAHDWQPVGLKVCALHPGWVATAMGGPSAPLTPAESVAGMRAVLASLTPERSGGFYRYTGDSIAW